MQAMYTAGLLAKQLSTNRLGLQKPCLLPSQSSEPGSLHPEEGCIVASICTGNIGQAKPSLLAKNFSDTRYEDMRYNKE